MMTAPPRPAWHGLARQVLHLSIHHDHAAAAAMLTRLIARHGHHMVTAAMCVWIDAVLAYISPPRPGRIVEMRMFDDDWRRVDPDQQPAPQVWACRMITARAADDLDSFNALILSAPEVPDEYGDWVQILIQTCAENIRELRRAGAHPTHTWPAQWLTAP